MYCLNLCNISNEFSLSNIESKVQHQLDQFHTTISTAVPGENDAEVNEQLQRIRNALDAALGFMAGLVTEFEATLNSEAFGQGKAVSTAIASGATKAVGGGSIAGAIAGILTEHEWVLYVGLGVGAACLIADFAIISYMAFKSQESKKNSAALNLPVIYRTSRQAANISACIKKFKNCQSNILEESDFIRKATNCLKKYKEITGKDENVLNKITSLLIEKLPIDHQIRQQINEVYASAINLNHVQAMAKSAPILDSDQDDIEMQAMGKDNLDSDLALNPHEPYQQALQKCQKSIAETFHLKKSSISFIEIKKPQTPRLRFNGQGIVEIH